MTGIAPLEPVLLATRSCEMMSEAPFPLDLASAPVLCQDGPGKHPPHGLCGEASCCKVFSGLPLPFTQQANTVHPMPLVR